MNVNELSDEQLNELRTTTIQHAAKVIIDNASSRGNDGGDYLHGAIDILNDVTAYDDEDNNEQLRRYFNLLFTADLDSNYHPYNRYASDAIPPVWDEYIVNAI